MGNLISLKYLDLSQNSLQFLPGSIRKLRLLEIDVSSNSFSITKPYYACMVQLPSLVECAARIFMKTRFAIYIFYYNYKYCFCSINNKR